jgi:ABC-2 type transport system permease protein
VAGVGSLLRTAGASFDANIRSVIRYYTFRGYVVSSLLFPIFMIATAWVIAQVVGGTPADFRQRTGYPDYLSYVIIGFAFTGLVTASLEQGGNTVYSEQLEGTWELVALTPASKFAWMTGKTLAFLLNSALNLVLVFLLGWAVFGMTVVQSGIPLAILGILLAVLSLQGFSFLMAGIGMVWKQPHAIAILLSPFFIFISGMMFPVDRLPVAVQYLSYSFPLTYGLNIIRGALLKGLGPAEMGNDFQGLLVTSMAMMVIGFVVYRRMDGLARRSGSVGTY